MRYSCILIDLDKTILDFDASSDSALKRLLEFYNVAVSDSNVSLYQQINDVLWRKHEAGEVTREQVLVGRFEDFFTQLGVEADPVLSNEMYLGFLSENHDYMPQAEWLSKELKRLNRTVIIATNGVAFIQNRRIAESGLTDRVDAVAISEEIGFVKPDRRFFEAAITMVGCSDKSQCLIVGDLLTSDVLGGINSGIDTVWFNYKHKVNNTDIKPTYEIHELPQLLDII